MYDATIGRWLSQDPLGFEAGDENLYRYVANNPMNATDPSGLQLPLIQGEPLEPDLWYAVAQTQYRRARQDVRDVLNQIDHLVSDPADYYGESFLGYKPGIYSLNLTLGNRLGVMQSAADSVFSAGGARFRESFESGDLAQAFGGRARQILDDIDMFIEDYVHIQDRVERVFMASIGVDFGRYNAWDRACLRLGGHPLGGTMTTADGYRRTWIGLKELTIFQITELLYVTNS